VKLKRKNIFFEDTGHLSHQAIAMCAEGMTNGVKQLLITDDVKNHLAGCSICQEKIIALYHVIADEPEIMDTIAKSGNITLRNSFFFRAKKGSFIFLSLAAFILLLVALNTFLFKSSLTPEQLFDKHFSPYQNLITVKGAGDYSLSRAMLFYDVKDYDSAVILFKAVIAGYSNQAETMFYLGNAYLALHEADSGIVWLEKSLAANTKFSNAAQWYLSLAYLKSRDVESAKTLLKKIQDNGGFYSKKADKLLDEIE